MSSPDGDKITEKGEIDEESEDSYGFINISVGIWKDSANEDDDYWTTILIGKKDYYI